MTKTEGASTEGASKIEKSDIQAVTDGPHAPIVFFDSISSFGSNQGIVNLTLTCARLLPEGEHIVVAPVVVSHLRCSVASAKALKDALEKALLLMTMTPGAGN